MVDTPDEKKNAKAKPNPEVGVDASNVETVKVKTTGEFLVHDIWSGQTVEPGDAQEVTLTPFIRSKIEDKSLVEA